MYAIHRLIIAISLTSNIRCIPVSDFYPFGASVNDHDFPKNDDGSSPRVNISTLFPFFNNQHDSLFVNTNGAISFQTTLNQFTPAPFPLNDNRRIIAPFWADVDIRKGGTVWYRETTDPAILQRATNDTRLYYPDQIHFRATWVFIATWDNVAFYGASANGKTKRNTFQAVLITNGRHSFTIFNYAEVTWTTGTASQGNANTGLGGTPAQVGFNGGDGVNYFALKESRTAAIVNLPHMSNIKVNGKFMFRIDTARIENGGCNTGGTLTIYPRYVAMYGGEEIIVSGPCISPSDTITLIYPNNVTQPCTRRSEFSIGCITPTLYVVGNINLSLRIVTSNGTISHFKGFCTSMNPLKSNPKLVRVFAMDWARGTTVEMQWEPNNLSFTEKQADIVVYSIEPNSDHLPRIVFEKTLVSAVHVNLSSVSFRLDVNSSVAVIKMTEAGKPKLKHSVWSDAFIVKPKLDTKNGQQEVEDTCSKFMRYDDTLPPISNLSIQSCPCRIDQIEVDVARFHEDPLCKGIPLEEVNFKTSRNCQQVEAEQCFRLNIPGPGNTGHLCCYDYDGNFMDARTETGGGTEHRFYYMGGPGNVPYLSTLYFDTTPYYHCCKYMTEITGDVPSTCFDFLRRRPQGDCRKYQPITPGRLSGDPHFTTLDGFQYTFNGVGEFVLLKHVNESFFAQARMEQVKGTDGKLRKASVITAFAGKSINFSDTVEVQLNSIRLADVLLNGEILDFTHYRSLHFKGVSTSMSEYNSTDGSSKQINVIFTEPNIAFRILVYPALLNVIIVSGSDSIHGNISGLLGNYNGNPNDDLTAQDGSTLPPNASDSDIHHKFGLTWMVREEDSLFTYPIGKSYISYKNVGFTPMFQVPNQTFPQEARDVCGNDTFCLYDFQTTGRRDIAVSTRAVTRVFETIVKQSEPVIVCGHPRAVDNGFWNYTNLVQNSSSTLACKRGYTARDADEISCQSDGEWQLSNDSCIEMHCSDLPTIKNGVWISTNDIVGSNASLICDVGASLNGSETITCDSDGTWGAIFPTCEKIHCGPLHEPQYGRWITSGTTFGDTGTLVCDEGKKPSNGNFVICNENGNWNSTNHTCDPVHCGQPKPIVNGQWNVTGHTYASEAHLKCDYGTTLSGFDSIICTGDGKWSHEGQACEKVICGPLTNITGGNWNVTDHSYGSVARLECNYGTSLSGNDTVVCTAEGNWSRTGQSCDTVDPEHEKQTTLKPSTIGGIAAGVVILLFTIVLVIFIYWRQKNNSSKSLETYPNKAFLPE